MSDKKLVTLYHASPRERRKSIQTVGLRCCTWLNYRLVTYAMTAPDKALALIIAADRHGVRIDDLDVWKFRVDTFSALNISGGVWVVSVDIPPSDLTLIKE